MEPIRASLMPPSNVGTKGRAIQQAKEMEQLVAERAKRSGEEPPQYDFIELIGKGAYGRVFKGYVCFHATHILANNCTERIVLAVA